MRNLYAFVLSSAFAISAQAQFVNPLYIPPTLSGDTFYLTANDTTHQFYPNITTNTFGYNGSYLGPTLMWNQGDSVHIVFNNQLPEETTVHWHGLHVAPEHDGGPHTHVMAGATWTPSFLIRNAASMCWYHPHVHENTMPQVNKGLAGAIYIYDTIEAQLNLPRTYGVDDFPIIMQDRTYAGNGDFVFDALADSVLINGTPNAYLNLPQQVVRLRLLNGSNARTFVAAFNDNRNFYVIASDGGLLTQPYLTNSIKVANGERYEILVDLSGETIGNTLQLISKGSTLANNEAGGAGMPNGQSPLNGVDFPLFEIRVTAPTANPVVGIPTSLITHNVWSTANVDRTRIKNMQGQGMFDMGNLTINGILFDMMVINDTVYKDNIEIWRINNTSNISHPFHIHDIQFYIISRNGQAPLAYEAGLKDVVHLKQGEYIEFITKFETFTNDSVPYMYHCHNLHHEDMGMMGQFLVIEEPTGTPENLDNRTFTQIYPNPGTSFWQVNKFSNNYTTWTLTDLQGRVVKTGTSAEATFQITTEGIPAGMYVLTLNENGQTQSLKVIKR